MKQTMCMEITEEEKLREIIKHDSGGFGGHLRPKIHPGSLPVLLILGMFVPVLLLFVLKCFVSSQTAADQEAKGEVAYRTTLREA